MKIHFGNSPVACHSDGETILLSCARSGIVLSAPCGGRGHCGKCRVQLLEGQVSGDTPDADGMIRACRAIPVSDIAIAMTESVELAYNALADSAGSFENSRISAHKKIARPGIAMDIGTTTISARLVDLDSSTALDTISELNDQRVFGADVMSRIAAAKNNKTNDLFDLINRQTGRIIRTFQKRWDLGKIEKLAVSANTVMLHLFLNVDPSGMGALPFTPEFLEEREVKGELLSLPVETVIILPSIAAFVGADITAGLAVLDFHNAEGPSILIDIGTNGEMALADKGKILCCSTAAGPAFEGAEISCGMGGVMGAISAVEAAAAPAGVSAGTNAGATALASAGGISVTTIGNVPPRGICGSGLIDAVAVMLKQGIIDETGSMVEKEFYLAPGVSITNWDVRQFQLAKSAILSGIRILCKNAGLKTQDIKDVFIAGAFGFFINKKNAVASGIFPVEFLAPMVVSGNLSLQGAEECLFANDFMDRCKEIISRCSVIDLAADPLFMDEFAENMLFDATLRP